MSRTSSIKRTTTETSITLSLDLDGTGAYEVNTGLGFFDHMLSLFGKHAKIDLKVEAKGDLHVDEHHLIEDVGISLGTAILEAVGDKRGIERFGTGFVAMDEALARTIIDLSGRSYLVFMATFSRESINGFPLEMTKEFFQAIANEGRMNLHIACLYGSNAHHQIEAMFKSFGRALGQAVLRTGSPEIPSTKGIL
ncbi:MAG: imidazoleglycerol-phosphate dehydratase HisB [Ignavibacteria bacterium]|nr:imidazoleglycerol-phosphate dehydratase HisB [Ignavibacteria bacterium]